MRDSGSKGISNELSELSEWSKIEWANGKVVDSGELLVGRCNETAGGGE